MSDLEKEIHFENSKATISSEGAFVSSLVLNGVNILKKSTDGYQTHGGASVLFPYADIVDGAKYKLEGKTYRLPKNGSYEGNLKDSIHGLVLDKRWNIIHKEEYKLLAELILKDKYYPTSLSIKIDYKIGIQKFIVNLASKNIGHATAPIMCGFHPYFIYNKFWRFKFHDPIVFLKNLRNRNVEVQSSDSEIINYDDFTQFDNAYLGGGDVEFITRDRILKIHRINMPFFEIYNGQFAGKNSVAFEPMTGAPNCFNNKVGLRYIRPGEAVRCGYTITIENSNNNSTQS